jgi:hypothetical protein
VPRRHSCSSRCAGSASVKLPSAWTHAASGTNSPGARSAADPASTRAHTGGSRPVLAQLMLTNQPARSNAGADARRGASHETASSSAPRAHQSLTTAGQGRAWRGQRPRLTAGACGAASCTAWQSGTCRRRRRAPPPGPCRGHHVGAGHMRPWRPASACHRVPAGGARRAISSGASGSVAFPNCSNAAAEKVLTARWTSPQAAAAPG